jgi:hypothetical protein
MDISLHKVGIKVLAGLTIIAFTEPFFTRAF